MVYRKDYYEKNKQRLMEINKKYSHTEKGKATARKYMNKYYAQNKDKMREQARIRNHRPHNKQRASKYSREKNLMMKVNALLYLGGKVCSRCGDNTLHPCCYDFHHTHDKLYGITTMINNGMSWDMIKKELDKCVILCRNCHAIVEWDKHS